MANGIEVAVLADADHESVLTSRRGQEPRVLRGADRIDLEDVLPGFELRVKELFQALRRS